MGKRREGVREYSVARAVSTLAGGPASRAPRSAASTSTLRPLITDVHFPECCCDLQVSCQCVPLLRPRS